MPAIFAALAKDEARNTLIIDDVLAVLEAGRNPLLLTERRDHLSTSHRASKAPRETSPFCAVGSPPPTGEPRKHLLAP